MSTFLLNMRLNQILLQVAAILLPVLLQLKYRKNIMYIYYLFKRFLVSDWLTANCEIVISTQWLTKYGFFTFILAK